MSVKYYFIGLCCCLIIAQGWSAPKDATDVAKIETTTPDTTDLSPSNAETTIPATPSTTTVQTTPSTKTEPTTPSTTTEQTTPTTTTEQTTPTTTTKQTTPTTTTKQTTPSTPETTPTPPSTTPKSTTTASPLTTAAPPAPPSPTPLPDPEVGSWVLKNTTTNLTCVVIHTALRMKIPYLTTNNKTEWGLVNLNKTANITGRCDDDSMLLNVTSATLSWDNNTNFLEITFRRYNESKTFNITELHLSQTTSGDAFPNSTGVGPVSFRGNGSGLFAVESVPLGSSYRCSHKVNLNLTEESAADKQNALLTFSKVQIQAYANSTTGGFGAAYDCPGMDASDIVPIAVGCALAGLVIGVLIAYLVGRRRSHARGYLSM